MKIVLLASWSRSLINFRGPLIDALLKCGYEVVGCAPEQDDWTTDQLQAKGAQFESIQLARTGIDPVQDLRSLLSMYRTLRRLKPDTTLAYTAKPVIYGTLAAWLARVPRRYSIITGLGYAFGGETFKKRVIGRIVQLLYRLSLSRNRAVFFQNPDDMALFKSLGLVRQHNHAFLINGSGIDLNYYAPQPPVTDPPTFLLMARLIKEKGILEYAQAAKALKEKYPHVRFQLLGHYDSNPSAISEAQVQEWQGYIEYLGNTTDVRPFLAGASVFVLPTYYREGTPRSILEAMSMGRPIITTDAPGCRETVIHGETGFLIPKQDVNALQTAIERFIMSPELIEKMGTASRKLAEEKYDVHKVNQAILDVLTPGL